MYCTAWAVQAKYMFPITLHTFNVCYEFYQGLGNKALASHSIPNYVHV